MSVKIDIGADPGVVVSAFTRIKDSLREARQAAADFAAIDMSHAELAALEDQIKRLTAALLQMQRAATGIVLSHGIPTPLPPVPGAPGVPPPGVPIGPLPGVPGASPGVAPPGAGGSPPAPPAPPAAPPPRPPRAPRGSRAPGSSGGGGGGGAVSAIVDMLRGPIGFALSLAGVGGAAKMIGQGVSQAETDRIDSDHLLRTLRDSAFGFDNLRESVHRASGEIGATFGDMSAMALRYARIAGSGDGTIVDRTKYAAGFARGYGMDEMEGVKIAASAENAGIDPKELAAAIGDALEQGGMQGRQDEVANAILKWGEAANRQTGDSHWRDFAGLYTQLNAGPYTALRGAGGESFLANMNSTIMQGGAAGEASQIFASRAMADAGVRDLNAQQYALDGGMFQNLSADGLGGKNVTLLDAEMQRLNREYGTGLDFRKLSALKGVIGGNEHIDKQFYQDYSQGKINIGQSETYLQAHHLSLAEINPSAWAEVSGVVGAKSADLPGLRDKMLGRTDLTDAERNELKAAGGEGLRESMVRAYAKHGMTATPGSHQEDVDSAFSNSMTAAADKLVDPLNKLKEGVTKLTDVITDGMKVFGAFLSTGKDAAGDSSRGYDPPHAGDGTPWGDAGYTPIGYRFGGGGFNPGLTGRFSNGSGGPPSGGRPVVTPGNLAADRALPPEARALLDTIAGPESKGDYSIINGGRHFSDMSHHPDWVNPLSGSSAAGRYQFISPTWRAANQAAGGGLDFSPMSQDRGAWALAQQVYKQKTGGDLLTALRDPSKRASIQRALGGSDLWTTLNLNGYENNLARESWQGMAPLKRASATTGGGSIRAEPIRVIHMTPSGRVLREELLPVTYTPRPEIA